MFKILSPLFNLINLKKSIKIKILKTNSIAANKELWPSSLLSINLRNTVVKYS